jgi:Xaa-Pro aminopeptidase
MLNRIKKIRKVVSQLHLDAFFITNHDNITYLTEFSGLSAGERESYLLITQKEAYFLTFPTYYKLFKNVDHSFDVLNITSNKKLHHHLQEIIEKEKIKLIGIEKENLTLSEFIFLRKKLKIELKETTKIVENLRIIKEKEEIEAISQAANVGDLAFEFIKTKIKGNISEKFLALELEFFIKKRADDIAFSPIVAFDKNAAIPHYLPSHNSQLTTNNLILLDFGAKISGYCSDMTRVIFFGKPINEQIKAYQAVLKAQQLSLKKLKAGLKGADLDKQAKKYLVSYGYPEYQHGLGHGVGISVHEAPRLRLDSQQVLTENMVVTLEPAIYLEDEYGIRIEDLVVLKKEGVEVLSKSSKSLKEIIIL